MYLHMNTVRTTIVLPASLFQEAKISAIQQSTTLTQLITRGLSLVLNKESATQQESFAKYLEKFTPTVKPITQDTQDQLYKNAVMKKHG